MGLYESFTGLKGLLSVYQALLGWISLIKAYITDIKALMADISGSSVDILHPSVSTGSNRQKTLLKPIMHVIQDI